MTVPSKYTNCKNSHNIQQDCEQVFRFFLDLTLWQSLAAVVEMSTADQAGFWTHYIIVILTYLLFVVVFGARFASPLQMVPDIQQRQNTQNSAAAVQSTTCITTMKHLARRISSLICWSRGLLHRSTAERLSMTYNFLSPPGGRYQHHSNTVTL